jgi:hypothetical protein
MHMNTVALCLFFFSSGVDITLGLQYVWRRVQRRAAERRQAADSERQLLELLDSGYASEDNEEYATKDFVPYHAPSEEDMNGRQHRLGKNGADMEGLRWEDRY